MKKNEKNKVFTFQHSVNKHVNRKTSNSLSKAQVNSVVFCSDDEDYESDEDNDDGDESNEDEDEENEKEGLKIAERNYRNYQKYI